MQKKIIKSSNKNKNYNINNNNLKDVSAFEEYKHYTTNSSKQQPLEKKKH